MTTNNIIEEWFIPRLELRDQERLQTRNSESLQPRCEFKLTCPRCKKCIVIFNNDEAPAESAELDKDTLDKILCIAHIDNTYDALLTFINDHKVDVTIQNVVCGYDTTTKSGSV